MLAYIKQDGMGLDGMVEQEGQGKGHFLTSVLLEPHLHLEVCQPRGHGKCVSVMLSLKTVC